MRALALIAALLASGCEAARGPEEVAARFHKALAQGDGRTVLALLDEGSRRRLTEQAKAASAASGGALPAEPERMVVQGARGGYGEKLLEPTAAPAAVTLVDKGGGQAKVRVDVGPKSGELTLVHEGGQWRITLPAVAKENAHDHPPQQAPAVPVVPDGQGQ